MTKQEVIKAYLQALRNEDVLMLDSFLTKSGIESDDKLLKDIYLQIKGSDYYHLLIDRTFKTEEGPVFPYYELTPEGLKALNQFSTLQEYCDAHGLGLRDSEFHQSEKQYPNNPDNAPTNIQESQNILKRIYDLTNHQVIGGIIVAVLGAVIIAYLAELFK